jgi:hypothetical protein
VKTFASYFPRKELQHVPDHLEYWASSRSKIEFVAQRKGQPKPSLPSVWRCQSALPCCQSIWRGKRREGDDGTAVAFAWLVLGKNHRPEYNMNRKILCLTFSIKNGYTQGRKRGEEKREGYKKIATISTGKLSPCFVILKLYMPNYFLIFFLPT